MEITQKQPAGKIVWIAWSIAMLLLLFYVVDAVFVMNIMSFEVFISFVLFFIIVLLLITLGWILIIRNKYIESNRKVLSFLKKLMSDYENLAKHDKAG